MDGTLYNMIIFIYAFMMIILSSYDLTMTMISSYSYMMIKDDYDYIHLLLLRHGLGGGHCLETETPSSRVGNAVSNLKKNHQKKFMMIIIVQ